MTSDPTLKRRVDRLQNDTEALYELIGDFRSDFNLLRGEFSDLRGEFTDLRGETRTRFDAVEETLREVLRRLPAQS